MSSAFSFFYLFISFFISNSILAYAPLPIPVKVSIGIFGILFPAVWFLFSKRSLFPSGPVPAQTEFLPVIPWSLWLGVIGLSAFFRFFMLTTYSLWPNFDEGWIGYFASHLWMQSDLSFFLAHNRDHWFYTCLLYLEDRFLGPSLRTFWLLPALLSFLALPIAYWAASKIFSRSFAFVFASLLALSYWPWYAARIGEPTALLLLGQSLVFLALGLFLRARHQDSFFPYMALGLSLGLTVCLIGFHWFLSAFSVSVVIVINGWNRNPGTKRRLWVYFGSLFLVAAPFLWLQFGIHGLQTYYQFISNEPGVPFLSRVSAGMPQFSCLFWGVSYSVMYGPVWGGFFNPVLGSFFMLGLLEVLRDWRQPLHAYLLFALALFFAPGFISNDLETFRILLVIFPFLAVATTGLVRFSAALPKGKSWMLLGLLVVSLALDAGHFGRYHQICASPGRWWDYAKSMERYRAYGFLKKVAVQQGPGIVLSDFGPYSYDQTLSAVDGLLNILENPAWTLADAHWAALLINVNYKPFLERRFGPGEAWALSSGKEEPDGGLMLWVVPLTATNRPVFQRWAQASKALTPFITTCLNFHYVVSERAYLDSLALAYPAFQKDPFLESCFWERMADLYVKCKSLDDSGPPAHPKAIECLRKAIRLGYPAAHLYYRIGAIYRLAGQEVQAEKAFIQATRCPINLTESGKLL